MTITSTTSPVLDTEVVTTARGLSIDAVERAGSGHPGTALALTPVAQLLYGRHLRHDPADPQWAGRDRFVLSCGHASILQYVQLYLSGYDLTLDDLRSFRRIGSRTAGHPEYGHTVGVEMTTGPLGQGLASSVGMAMGFARQRALFDPEAPAGESPFDRAVWVLCSDGDLQEGISYEAGALAGRHELGALNVVFDDNRIQIEGETSLTTGEDIAARFEAQGWHVQHVGLAEDGDIDVAALDAAMTAARDETARPSIIVLRSQIAWPAPNAINTPGAHGSPLGGDEAAATKIALGLDPAATFVVSDEVRARADRREEGARIHRAWDELDARWREREPERASRWDAVIGDPGTVEVPAFEAGTSVATRSASGACLAALAPQLPQLWGGSADLGDSNKTTIPGEVSFLPESRDGRIVHFGVREHAMAAIANGIALAGGSLPYVGTFLVFSDYMRGAIRLAALMGLPVTYVWTHDSVALGADGPTHQPIEHLASLRAMPGLDVVRPADAKETAVAWRLAAERRTRPMGLVLARQNVPVLDADDVVVEAGVRAGAYAVLEPEAEPEVVVVATGSEVALAVEAARSISDEIAVRVVSMPCREWFLARPAAERDALLPPGIRAVVVEAASSFGWAEVVGRGAGFVTVDRFGASGDAEDVQAEVGLTVENVVAALRG
ncbi:transketolase [Aeromicrobium sp. YIM 150415]|uniref:transketolase family protein n=1 Tax=Aeromicrobium sp. YIM 150415 TaxID=2803912 RepID=UPI001964488A|nr:transketolase [Aeromicrobium sp. YIM 150415]MBM9465252.1 transketolase [Aeromicrobium sp. YIM 150415]